MKSKRTVLCFIILTLSMSIYSQNAIKEIGIGLLQLKLGYYVPISDKSIVGINGSGGFYGRSMTPIIELAPTYKFYFSPQKNGTLFITSELYAQKMFRKRAQSSRGTTSLGLGAGIGYRVYFGENKRLYFSPSVSFRVPFYRHGGNNISINNLAQISLYKTTMNSISVGYRF